MTFTLHLSSYNFWRLIETKIFSLDLDLKYDHFDGWTQHSNSNCSQLNTVVLQKVLHKDFNIIISSLTLSLPEYLMEFCTVTLTFESVDEIL